MYHLLVELYERERFWFACKNLLGQGSVSGSDFEDILPSDIDAVSDSIEYFVIDQKVLSEGFLRPDAIVSQNFSVVHLKTF